MRAPACLSLLLGPLVLAGCRNLDTVADVGAAAGVATGALTQEEAESIQRSGKALARTFEDFTPRQEYYIGRAVGVTLLETYRVDDNAGATRYLNLVGQSIADAGPRPETFGGYRFAILDSTEVNAFAAPGGFVFITRGMLDLCRSEDEVAAVLAHEIAHVARRHGLAAIKQGRITDAFAILAAESARTFGGQDLVELTDLFEASINDVTSTLMHAGYSRDQERQADADAVRILGRIGYDPHALVRVLQAMEPRLRPGGRDFARTHPPPRDRIRDLDRMLRSTPATPVAAEREARFRKALGTH